MISIFLILFSYGQIYSLTEGSRIFRILIGRHRYPILLWLGILGLGMNISQKYLYWATSIKGGGYRHPSSAETLREKEHEDGSIRCDEQGMIDVAGFFEFAIREIPANMASIFEYAGESYEAIDFFLLHQASKFINDQIAKKMKVSQDKLPYSIHKFGNTSSVSIPLTMVSEIRDQLRQDKNRLFMSGFGAGLSWASAITSIDRCVIPKLVEI